jgi:hypothetical protein
MEHLAAMLWHSGDAPDLPDAFWTGLQAAWFTAHSTAVLAPLLDAGYDVLVDGWIYKFCSKLLLQGWAQPDLDVIFARVRRPDAVILLTASPAALYAGDLSVVEPGHRPHLQGFEDHDYAFYTRLTQSGLYDAYRQLNPDGTDHSWASDRFGGQRLDHALISPATGTIRECRYDHAPHTRRLTDHAALLITVGPDAGN